MSRRPSGPAPTTSSSAGRSARPPTRARPPRRCRARSRLFSRPREELLQEPLEVGVEGEQGAVKNELVAARYADGGEVLDFQIAERVGLVLDVDPAELGLRELLR